MKLLLTGKNGQLGFALQRALAPVGAVFAFDRTACDLTDMAALRTLIRTIQPHVIVNAAAYTAVDKAETETDLAFVMNAVVPEVLGQEAARLDALVVHYSTDYVFDGTSKTPYAETDTPNPQNTYGASKLAGEQALQASGAQYLIFRTSWVFGVHGRNFVKTILQLAATRDSLDIVADQVGAPTSADLIADISAHAICQAIGSKHRQCCKPSSGVYHLTAGGKTNWHAYACVVIERARKADKRIKLAPKAVRAIHTSDYPTPAKRPANACLDTQKLRHTFGVQLPDWHIGLGHVLEQMI